MYQALDAVFAAGVEDVLRADDVRLIVVFVRAPDSGLGGDMKDYVAAADRCLDDPCIGQATLDLFDAELFQVRIMLPRDAANFGSSIEQLPDDGAAKEAAAAGDEYLRIILFVLVLVPRRRAFHERFLRCGGYPRERRDGTGSSEFHW